MGHLRLLLLWILAMAPSAVVAQMSPGPLSNAHKDLDSPLQCASCHAFGAGKAQFRCLECHQEVARRLFEKRGYHATQVKADSGSNDCARCHSDHNGRQHRLVRWPGPREKFDHAQAGWRLEGKHAALKCAECHNAKNLDARDRLVLKRRDLNTAFAGLSTACANCHRDIHVGQFSAKCSDCHSQDTWKKPPGFSHDRAAFPLTGAHARVECAKCHHPATSAPTSPVQYKHFVAFQQCASCHRDPHGNAFAGDCARCHNANDWKRLVTSNAGGFDHGKTKFPLLGKHSAAACRDCHKTDNFKLPVASARCLDCHKDEHRGQFAGREDGGDCRSCHAETGWKPARFTVPDHSRTAYPLTGRHAAVECAKCHTPRGKDTQYKVAFAACLNCHKDQHGGQFASRHQNRCEDCHSTGGWMPSSYTTAAHNQSAFALKGAHAAVPCSGCHTARGMDTAYHPAAANCTDCHQSAHGTIAAASDCESCHSVVSWKERGRFDHTRTDFPLLGRHAAVDCLACHKPAATSVAASRPVTGSAVRTIPFRGASKDCGGCHADAHAGQFQASGDAIGCARCHTVLSWRPTEFDHRSHSTFALDGAHERVPCRLCHTQKREVEGRSVVLYKGTPRECKQCHR